MPDIEAIEVLQQAKERIFAGGWGQLTVTRRAKGGDTTSYCLEDGLCGRGNFLFQTPSCVVQRAGDYLRQACNLPLKASLWEWNDEQRSAGVIFDAIDRAIEIAKESEA